MVRGLLQGDEAERPVRADRRRRACSCWSGQQAFINVAVNLNLIPTKGMTLPFISYGGSSMLAMGLTMGLALALTRRRPGAYDARPKASPRPAPSAVRSL